MQEMTPAHFPDVFLQLLLPVLVFLLCILYVSAVLFTNRTYSRWPVSRTIFWAFGCVCALLAISGPLAERASTDFTAHMIGHLFLGMLAPLLMALALPMTLLLRTLPTAKARLLTRLLKSWPIRILTHPLIAALLNVGGLWLLYTTELYVRMHENLLLHVLVHLHVWIAGYLFTISILYFDPVYHRVSFRLRAIVLISSLAGHSILAKYLYAHPPIGVPLPQAEQGSMLMYYGGDAIDAVIIFLLCLQWYKAVRPRTGAHSLSEDKLFRGY